MKNIFLMAFIASVTSSINIAYATDLFPKETRSVSQREFERNEKAVNKEYDRQQAERTRESMRDTTHDGRASREVLGKETSLGAGVSGDGLSVSVRRSTD